MNRCKIVAYGGIIVALCLLGIITGSVIPSLAFTLPMLSGQLMGVMAQETDCKWAFVTYTAVSFLSVFLSPSRSPVIAFIMFFGYYPILHEYLCQSDLPKALKNLIGIVSFNASFGIWIKVMTMLIPTFTLMGSIDGSKETAAAVIVIYANLFFEGYTVITDSVREYYTETFKMKYMKADML